MHHLANDLLIEIIARDPLHQLKIDLQEIGPQRGQPGGLDADIIDVIQRETVTESPDKFYTALDEREIRFFHAFGQFKNDLAGIIDQGL